jgi:hypothetical protein
MTLTETLFILCHLPSVSRGRKPHDLNFYRYDAQQLLTHAVLRFSAPGLEEQSHLVYPVSDTHNPFDHLVIFIDTTLATAAGVLFFRFSDPDSFQIKYSRPVGHFGGLRRVTGVFAVSVLNDLSCPIA